MSLRKTIYKILKEETLKLPSHLIRRIRIIGDDIIPEFKKNALRYTNINSTPDVWVREGASETAWSMIPYDEDYEDELAEYSQHLKQELIETYGDDIKDYVSKVHNDSNNITDGFIYKFIKHEELNGGRGFTQNFPSWGDLIYKYGFWFPIDWWEIKNKLDNLKDGGGLLFMKPGDKYNNFGYYFTIKKVKLQI